MLVYGVGDSQLQLLSVLRHQGILFVGETCQKKQETTIIAIRGIYFGFVILANRLVIA